MARELTEAPGRPLPGPQALTRVGDRVVGPQPLLGGVEQVHAPGVRVATVLRRHVLDKGVETALGLMVILPSEGLHTPIRAVQRCRIGRTESDLQQAQPEVGLVTGERIPAPANVWPWGGNRVGGCRGRVFAVAGRAGGGS